MSRETVTIGCRIPNGLLLTHPSRPLLQVKINGCHGEKIGSQMWMPMKMLAITEVDAEFWEAWKVANAGLPAFITRSIFECKDERDATAKAKEMQSHNTGFEPMSQVLTIDSQLVEKGT